MLWLILGGLAAVAAALLLLGFLRRPRGTARVEHDMEVYRAQLRELERERDANLISGGDAEAAKIEIQRRMLAADRTQETRNRPPRSWRDIMPTAAVTAFVPVAAFGLYFMLGNPDVPSVPFAERPPRSAGASRAQDEPGQVRLADVEAMIARVRARLAESPDDLRGWTILGRSLGSLGQYAEAVDAFDRAIRLSEGDAELYGAKAEVMIAAAQGAVTPEARAVLAQALSLDPGDSRARFYMAAAKQQDGDTQAALDDLAALLADAPADAPWYDTVRQRAAVLATELGQDPDAVLPEAGVAAADPRVIAAQLAARLEQNPKDFQGWIELARVRIALDDPEGAREALDRGTGAYEGAPFVQQQIRQAAVELGLAETDGDETTRGPSREDVEAASEMTPEQQKELIRSMVGGLAERLNDTPDDLQGWRMLARSYGVLAERDKAAEAYRRVLALDPANGDALFFLGEAASAQGDKDKAVEYWTQLLTLLTPGSAEHTLVQERLNGL